MPVPIILVDENLDHLGMARECFSCLGEIKLYQPPIPNPAQLAQADMLIVRTVTKANATLLQNSKISFVGTASSGMEHIDKKSLQQMGIKYAAAQGCNARAVAEYVIAAISSTLLDQGREIDDITVGIIGHGNIGKHLAKMLRAIGAKCLLNDPPLADTDHVTEYVPLAEALQCDVISLHLPLTTDGEHPSLNLLDHAAIQDIKAGSIVINTSRGEVIDQAALCERANRGELTAIIDVWQNEPAPDRQHIKAAAVATPHVAGYSRNGKYRALAMLAEQMAHLFPEVTVTDFTNREMAKDTMHITESGTSAINKAATAVCDPYKDSNRLRQLAMDDSQEYAKAFSEMRNSWPLRMEFSQQRLSVDDAATANKLSALGFAL